MTISAQHIVAFTRLRVSAPSLLCWATLRGGLARLLPALIALWTRLPALLQFISVPALENENGSEKKTSQGNVTLEDEDGEVVCELLYSPPPGLWEMDVIFIHGLHGSTVKTWRQGDWNSKYRDVQKVPLRKHSTSSDIEEKIDICPNCHLLKNKPARSSSVPNGFCETDKKIQDSADESNTKLNNLQNSSLEAERKLEAHRSRSKMKVDKMKGIHEELEELSDSDDDILYFNLDNKLNHSLENNFKMNDPIVNSDHETNNKILPNNNIDSDLEAINVQDGIHDVNELHLLNKFSNNCTNNIKSDSFIDNNDDSLAESISGNLLAQHNKLHADDFVIEPIDDSISKASMMIGDICDGKHCDQIMATACDISNNFCYKNEKAISSVNCDNIGSCDNCARNYFGPCLKLQELNKINNKQILRNDLIEGENRNEYAPIVADNVNSIGRNDLNREFNKFDACSYEEKIQISGPMKRTHHFAKFCDISADLRSKYMDNGNYKVRKINISNRGSQFDDYIDLNDDFNEFFNNNAEYEQFQIDHYNSTVDDDCKSKMKNDELEQFTYDFLKKIEYFSSDEKYSINDEKYIKNSVSEPNLTNDRSRKEILDFNLKGSNSNSNIKEEKHLADDKNYYCTCDIEKKVHGCEQVGEKVEELLSSCWPRDWIPLDYPGARVISLNYTTDQHLWRFIWTKHHTRSSLEQRSRDMISQLDSIDAGAKPIIWVGHSKGGLFIKEMFADGYESWSKDGPDSAGARIYLSSRALVFYSVPHRGSPLANITLPPLLRVSSELEEIQHESEFVLKLHERFLRALNDGEASPVVLSYSETRRTLMGAFYLRIVSPQSADPGVGNMYGVSLDHREICKPTSRSCFLYKELLGVIRDIKSSSCVRLDSNDQFQ